MIKELVNKRYKFAEEFENDKRIIVVTDGRIKSVKNYKEFLQECLTSDYKDIEELEEFMISILRVLAIIQDIELIIYDELEDRQKMNSEKKKVIYLDNFQSIIDIVLQLNLAKILTVYSSKSL